MTEISREINVFEGLNPAQVEAVKASEGPVLILAGAGSGKTKCLTHRLAYLVATGKAKTSEILAVTFTNKAAQELGSRILKILGYDLADFEKNPVFTMRKKLPWVGTFHSICVRLLRAEAENIGLNPNFSIFDSDDSLALIRAILKDKGLDPKQYSPNAVYSIIENAKNELLTAEQYQTYVQGHFQQIAQEVYKEYEKRLKTHGALDFNDLIIETVRMLEKNLEIRNKYHQQFKYVMIDEYQDTNQAQYKLTKLLTNPGTDNVCVVGDDYQSIYQWRGANYKNILNFNRDFKDTQVFKLEQNYRSTKTILAGAAGIIKKVRNRSEKKLWTDNEDGPPITIYEASNAYDEANFIATEIRTLQRMGSAWSNFAILYRTNAQSRILEEVFLSESIPYRLVGALRFYERKEIKDMLSYLRFLLNANDRLSLTRIINVPPRKIGPKTLEKGGDKVDFFMLEMEKLRDMIPENPPTVILEALIDAVSYRDYLLDGTPEGEARWENVEELKNLATEFENLPDFLEHVALVADVDNYDTSAEAVTLMTLHSSKGLEFNTVFLSGMEEGLFPHMRALEEESEMDEERRLCYVGMTRAKKRLYMTHARQRVIHGMMTSTLSSRFLNEIEPGLVDRV
jgi:DNA helicase-2/ATP-dependent DNA helicase PcrA